MPRTSQKFLNVAAYKFVALDRLPQRRQEIRQRCLDADLRGTVLLSPEGINLFVAGRPEQIHPWLDWLRSSEELADLDCKHSYSDDQPFNRMLVRLKKEIIAFGVDGIDPAVQTAPKLAATELKRWLDEGRQVTLLDVRNNYEVQVGTFAGAHAIGIDHFRHFPAAVQRLPEPMKQTPVVMFCTGGIRCEKAGPLMQREGFSQVFQLDGGILKYFEQCGGEHYEGDCFVFDRRVALDPRLDESPVTQCYVCQAILTAEQQRAPEYVFEQSCPNCYRPPAVRIDQQIARRQAALRQIVDPLPGSKPHDNLRPINVPQRFEGQTLLECLCCMHPHVGRGEWLRLFEAGHILRGQMPARPHQVVRGGQQFLHRFPDWVEPDVNAEIRILWEDDALVVIDKPAPLPMHPCGRFNHNTVRAIMNRLYQPEVLRAAHRLDANTTGLVVLSRTRALARQVQAQFEHGTVEKVYLVLCHGDPEETFVCRQSIGRQRERAGTRCIDPHGAPSETRFRVLRRNTDGTALLEARPITGRTNQIRVHLWHAGTPVVGDPVYLAGGQLGETQTLDVAASPMCLHAWRLQLTHPLSGQPLQLEAPRPAWG